MDQAVSDAEPEPGEARQDAHDIPPAPPSEPLLLIPGSVSVIIALLAVIHIARSLLLSPVADYRLLLTFAFIPARYDTAGFGGLILPGGIGADVWTFVSYALLHGSAMHLIVNLLWLLSFGTAVARRFGSARFLVFCALASAAGAALHLALHFGEPVPVVGASAAISGLMAAATRFVFDAGGPLGVLRSADPRAYAQPARPLLSVLSNGRALTFLLVWFGLNLLVGLSSMSTVAGGASIAWEAHIGGFLFGLLAFPLFDPVPRRRETA